MCRSSVGPRTKPLAVEKRYWMRPPWLEPRRGGIEPAGMCPSVPGASRRARAGPTVTPDRLWAQVDEGGYEPANG